MSVFLSTRLSISVSILALCLVYSAQGFAFQQQRVSSSFGTTHHKHANPWTSPLIVGRMSMDDDDNDNDDAGIDSKAVNGLSEHSEDSSGNSMMGVDFDPTAAKAMDRPSKSDLYSQDELFDILKIHQQLQESKPAAPAPPETEEDSIITPSLHDMILQAVAEIDEAKEDNDDVVDDGTGNDETNDSGSMSFNYSVNQKIRNAVPNIRAIACDVDGTLISAEHGFHPRTSAAVQRAVEAAASSTEPLQYFFPATGKSRAGALASMGTEIATILSNVPGVFCQGLYCVDAQGNVVFEKKLTSEQVDVVEQLAQHYGVSLIAYDGDNLFATKWSDPKLLAEVHEKWGEPRPTPLESLADHEPGFHKVLIMDDDTEKIHSIIRPPLEGLANAFKAEVTQAVPTMLEFLPKGCSKARGVQELCKFLGIDPSTQLLAMGDAENDIGMLQLAAIGVAVGNALPMVKGAADIVVRETNDEGGAGVAIEKFGFGQGLDQ
jgi:Cof subfamily protein (haloacid dehalogenase superfamily)